MNAAIRACIFTRFLFLGLLCSFVAACGPKFVMLPVRHTQKEIVIGGPLGIQVDQFVFGQPSGNVDVLFVVDNTDTAGSDHRRIPATPSGEVPHGENLLTWFRFHYTALAEKLRNARSLNSRLQMITSSEAKLPKTHIEADKDSTEHFNEIFGAGVFGINQFLFANEEINPLTPFTSTKTALNHSTFQGRANVPLVIIYLLGRDSQNQESEKKEALQDSLNSAHREAFQTKIMTVSNNVEAVRPNCRYHYPNLVLSELEGLRQSASLERIDLCNLEAQPSLSDIIYNSISASSNGADRKYTLSRRPARPGLMTVRSERHLFQYGQEYTYDVVSNSIQFTPGAPLQPDDRIEISYHLTPAEPELPAGRTPGEPPVPRGETQRTPH